MDSTEKSLSQEQTQMGIAEKSLGELGVRALFLIWGFPRGTRRSQFMAQELGMDVEYVYFMPRQGALYALLKYPVQAVKTLIVLARRRPQVVFVQTPPIFATLVVHIWGLVTGTRYVIDSHTDALLARWWAWSLPLHRFLSRRAITTLVTNEHLRQMVATWDANAFILTDVPMTFPRRRHVQLDSTFFDVVIISTASYDEPISEILEAASNLPDVSFHITGDYQTKARHVIQSAPANIHFTGYVPDEEFYGLLEAAQVVMCLTTEDHTMQSGASEALWLGKPIITSDWPLLREYFNTGTLHVANTAEDIFRAVTTMRDNLAAFEDGIRMLREERRREWQQKAKALVCYVQQAVPHNSDRYQSQVDRGGSGLMKVLVVLGDGGHTTEMLKLLELLGPIYEYSYMMATNDLISEGKITYKGSVYRVPVPLGKYASQRNLMRAIGPIFRQLIVLLRARPEAILSTGANIAVPVSVFGRLLGVKVIHIETGSRVYTMSSTGKLMYRIAHLFFTQWEPLQKDYPKAIYAGRLL